MGFLLQHTDTSRVLAELFIFPKADIKTMEYRFNQLEPRDGQLLMACSTSDRCILYIYISSYITHSRANTVSGLESRPSLDNLCGIFYFPRHRHQIELLS